MDSKMFLSIIILIFCFISYGIRVFVSLGMKDILQEENTDAMDSRRRKSPN